MEILSISQLKETVHYFGRTFEDKELEAHFFNWTCSGFEIEFCGKCLQAELLAFETNSELPGFAALWPWVAIFVDNEDEPVNVLEVGKEKGWYTLFQNDKAEYHKIKVVKLSENSMGKVGVTKFKFEGVISALARDHPTCKLEFIGDSITCGFGNEVEERDAMFLPKEENGCITYGALATRQLNAECQIVAMSGISLSRGEWEEEPSIMPSMDELYEYTDRLYEERRGKNSDFQKWDFKAYVPDAIIINLGTNDVNIIKLAKDKKVEEQLFELNYIDFLKKVRQLNGTNAIICCTLGPLDYYLYDNIKRAVDSYQKQTNDIRIHCFKFIGVVQWNEGYGAVGHPSAKTHLRMSKELSVKLHELLNL